MQSELVLQVMKEYFEGKDAPAALGEFAALKPPALLKESLDVVDFIVYLEDELRCEIDPSEIGPALVNQTFGELATEISHRLKS